jgi:PAS domain S-box-containing protein
MEAVVAAADERRRDLIDRSPDGVVVLRHGRIVFLNSTAARLVGASDPRHLLETSFTDILHEESRAQIAERESRWLANQPSPPIDAQITRPDGTVVDVEIAGARLGDDELQIVVRDATGRIRAHQALRESEERLTLAFAGAQEGVWDWNLETGAVVYSSRWKQMLGYSDDDIEPHVRAWERLLHPDDLARAREVNEAVMRGGQEYELEVRLQHKDGHYVDVLSRGYPVRSGADEHVSRIVGTHLDLTERKRAEAVLRESEERLRLAFAGAQEGVWDWNLETGAVVYSRRWIQMLGYDPSEIEPHISAWERLVHPDDKPRADEAHGRVVNGESTYESEFRLRHKDGHYIHVLSRGFPVRREPAGPAIRIVGTHFDLTERKRIEAERLRTELLTHLVFVQEDERRRIAREMHDQFGEQLTSLSRRISTLEEACRSRSELQEHVRALKAIAQRLDRDIDQLVWELRPMALDDLGLRAALANYVQDWSQRVGISAALHTSGRLDDRLPSEIETTLYRIAQEAMTNVAKHAHAGNVDVILERRADHVLLIVEDDGVGFETSEPAGTRESARHGFGLLGMQERAALVGATIQIESAAGRGTTVLVRAASPDAPASLDAPVPLDAPASPPGATDRA